MRFNKRKWWFFGNGGKSIHLEISGWRSHPAIYFRSEGDEHEHSFHIGLGIGIWICFERFLSKKWYPKNYDTKEFSIAIHGGCLWWNFWVSEAWSSYTANKTWRKGVFHFMDLLKGKHDYQRVESDRRQFVLPFLEGIYNVEVIKWDRTDKWPRWPTRRMVTWEVRAGYYDGPPYEANWKDKPIPVEGKGENSYDCDEDATYSISFPGPPYKKDINTPYLAALYFWHSMMKSRERYGSAKWLPKAFESNKFSIIK